MAQNKPPASTEVLFALISEISCHLAALKSLLIRLHRDSVIDGVSVEQWLLWKQQEELEEQILSIGDKYPVVAERLQKILDDLNRQTGV